MAITFIILLIFALIIAVISNSGDSNNNSGRNINNQYFDKSNDILKKLINVQKIEECALNIQQTENVTKKESIYFAITSLLALIDAQPNINKFDAERLLKSIVNTNYSDLAKLMENATNNFDFVEQIAYNAKQIQDTENKDRKEALYLTICMFYDDLTQKRSQKGIKDLMTIVQVIYPDLFNEVMTYAAWRYEPNMVFKPEFDEYMRKRHS